MNESPGERQVDERPVDERVQDAVRRAREAQGAWGARPVRERVQCLRRFRALAFADRARIAATVRAETGKPTSEALVADVTTALDGARFLAGVAERALSPRRTRSGVLAAWRKRITVHHDPYGVVAVVSPWNYPFYFPAMHTMAALVAGNAVVLKPSEHTPRSADLVVELLHRAGVPQDVLTIVHGAGEAGAALVRGSVDKVFFTGSERTGRSVAEACAGRFVPVSLELGGSDPAIVLDDANLDVAASGIVWGRFTNAGQTCAAVKRVIALDRVHDPLVDRIVAAVAALRTGGSDGADVGGVITAGQRELVDAQLADAIAQGARVVFRRDPDGAGDIGVRARQAPLVVLADVTPAMRVWHEETFGPLLVVHRAATEEDAIAIANDTRYGLSASVWSTDRARGERVAARVAAGAVTLNDAVVAAGLPEVPHGGVKSSGIGRIHGIEGLLECTRTRTVVRDLLPGVRQPWWFGYGARTERDLDGYLRLAHGRTIRERLSGVAGAVRLLLFPERPL